MTSETDYQEMALRAYTELTEELTSVQTPPKRAHSSLESVLAEIAPLPSQGLFLGMASDGLPILLDLHDPSPGALLIAGDESAGRTAFLQTIARAVSLTHSPEQVQFGVLTAFPEDWQGFADLPHLVGIYDPAEENAIEFLEGVNTWAHDQKDDELTVLVLMDNLLLANGIASPARQTLRWLFLRGPNRQAWPIVTLDAARANEALPWLDIFHTRILGKIENQEAAEVLTGIAESPISSLPDGFQFALREGRSWLKFWIPDLDE